MAVYSGPEIVNSGLILHLDAANLRSYTGSGTTWNDLSNNSGTGTLINGPTFDSNNKGSITFDGSNDRVHIVSTSRKYSWAPVGTTGHKILSIECWVKTSDTAGSIISKPWNGLGNYNYRITSSAFITQVATFHSLSFTSIADGTWKHVVAVANETQKAVYVNGVLSAGYTNHSEISDTPSSGDSNISLTLMSLYPYDGDSTSRPEQAILGGASIFKIYNKELSAAEIKRNFEAKRGRYGI
jgi:hypothetical protein